MKNYCTLARKEVLSQKLTSFLILIAVILSTMMTTAVGQSAGVLSAMRQQQAIVIGGDRYATFVQLTEEKAQMLEKDPRLSYAGRFVPLGDQKLNDQLSLDLTEYWKGGIATRPAYSRLAQGRLPQAPMEIALPEDALQFLGFTGQVEDKISLSLSKALRHGIVADAYEYTAEFTLVGITESNFLGYTGGHILGLAGQGTAKAVLPPEYLYYSVDIRTESKKNFQSVMDDLCEKLEIHELDTLYNVPLLNALGISFDTEAADTELAVDDAGFSWLVFAGVLVVSLILLAAGLVIYNILKIAVSRCLGQYGMLRALGAEKGQLYRIVAAEILYLCMAGIPTGLLLGALSAKGILLAALSQLSPEMFLAGDSEQLQALIDANSTGKWGYLLISAFITLLFAFLAAAPAARFAARVSPVRAMSGTGVSVKRRKRTTGKIRSFERYYARLNLSRSRGRTAVTVLSLIMSITVFITLQSFLSLLGVSGSLSEHLGDYSIVNPYEGISPKELQEMEADEKIAQVAAQQFSLYELDEQNRPKGVETDISLGVGETFQIFGFNDIWMDYAFSSRLTKEQLEQLKAGEGCVIRNPIPMEIGGESFGTTHVEEGSTVTVSGKKLPVLLSMEGYDDYFSVGNRGFVNGVQVLVSDRIYSSLTGTDTYAELRPGLTADADRAAFDQVLEEFCRRVPGTVTVSYEQTDRQYEESEAQIRLLAWGLILFIGLIGILNIVNTVYTNIHTRITEIGIQRAMGMSAGSLYRVFLWEGFYYGISAAVIGCITGYIGTVFVEAGATDTLRLTAVPVVPMACASLFAIGACILTTCIPLRKISRMSIVDSIELVE